ncbi:MAG: YbaK/EbsC family protein [Patescibacteria group bacterium]
MAIPKKLLKSLTDAKVKYEILKHKTVFTAYDLAQTTKQKLQEIAKTVLVKADKKFFLVVIPAHYQIDFKKLKVVLGVKKVDIAREGEMKSKFNVKPGAMTPFGSLHKVDVVADRALLKVKQALFSAGSFTESLRMKVKDYMKTEQPKTGSFGTKW